MDDETKIPEEVREYMRKNGSRGGKIGGKRSLVTMTPCERKKRASKAGTASAKKLTKKQRRERAAKAAAARHSK